MKTFKSVLKIAALAACICGLIFTVVYFRDEIKKFIISVKNKCAKACPYCREESDFDDI